MYFKELSGKEQLGGCWQVRGDGWCRWRKSLYKPTQPGFFFYCSLLLADAFCGRFMEQPGAELISQNEMLA